MKKFLTSALCALFVASTLFVVGCGEAETTPPKKDSSTKTDDSSDKKDGSGDK